MYALGAHYNSLISAVAATRASEQDVDSS